VCTAAQQLVILVLLAPAAIPLLTCRISFIFPHSLFNQPFNALASVLAIAASLTTTSTMWGAGPMALMLWLNLVI
jgi:hypothetical protein